MTPEEKNSLVAERGAAHLQWNPWKLTTMGLLVMFATALITGVVVARYVGTEKQTPVTAEGQAATEPTAAQTTTQLGQQPSSELGQQAPVQRADRSVPAAPVAARPATRDINACNRYASSVGHNKTTETLTDALIGGAVGAGLGAASGAIAGGGGGAGKGAGIGGLVGAAAGTVYGLSQANRGDAQAAAAYRACMRRRGYTD